MCLLQCRREGYIFSQGCVHLGRVKSPACRKKGGGRVVFTGSMHAYIYTSGAIFRKGGQKCGQGRGAFYLQQTRVLYIYSSIYTGAVKHLFFISQIQIYYTYVAVYSYYLRLRNSQCTNGFRIQKHINHLIAHFIEFKKSINNGLTSRLYYIFNCFQQGLHCRTCLTGNYYASVH